MRLAIVRRPVSMTLQETFQIRGRDTPFSADVHGTEVRIPDPRPHGDLTDLQKIGHFFHRKELARQHLRVLQRR